jgi:hypothetical protein
MSATGITLLAALIRRVGPINGPRGEDLKWRFLPAGLYLAGALLVAAAAIALASRWRRTPRSATATASEQLTEFRLLYEKGEMSREEFERVRARLSTEIRGIETASSSQPTPIAPTPASVQSPPAPTDVKTNGEAPSEGAPPPEEPRS